ncbi:winged helix-turn-helix domain-containing protein [Streptomyces sp. NPDC006265]|uniref:GntR family transcriptional regulator n=1 Tax=Streptomyces sp. NPDC006265 TaxID=3156740 RepID=UPI0033BF0229
MTLPLEDDPRPPYLQAAEVLRAKVYSGEYAAGSQLPSARVLQEDFGVSSSTVQNALRVLKREGLVYSVLGRGSYVSGTHPGLPPAAGTAPSRFPDAAVTAEHDPRPPYVRTADLLREEIRSGNLPGGRLPSARELQDRFGIANSTAQNAVRVLKREGLVYAVKGRGVFVRSTAQQGESLLGEKALSAQPDSRERARTDQELAADLAAAEQRLARAADAYQAAGAQLDVLIREARRRGMPVPTAARERDGASA